MLAIGLAGGAALAVLGGLAAFLFRDGSRPRDGEHSAPDLALDQPRPEPGPRVPDAFRPDPTAPVLASEREGLRPATGPAPTLAADRGELRSQTGPANRVAAEEPA